MALLRLGLLLVLVQDVQSVSPKELEQWFSSSAGLNMSSGEAEKEAASRWQTLTQCGVTVKDLQALKDAMSDSNHLACDVLLNRQRFFQFVEQHVNPSKVTPFYDLLSSSYTLYGGLGYDHVKAFDLTLQMLANRAEPETLKALYRAMYGYDGVGLVQESARVESTLLAWAGADATAFKVTYLKSKDIVEAQFQAVAAYLSGLERRYAKDGTPYTAAEFWKHYGIGPWLEEWNASPVEKRLSNGKAYTASQFSRHSPSSWTTKFKSSKEVTQVRLAGDGKAYTMAEFRTFYDTKWRSYWAYAPELPCKECVPYMDFRAASTELVV